MRKRQSWYSFQRIVPALLIVPPLGLVLLWKSPRTLRAKAVVSALFLLFAVGMFAGAVKFGYYERYIDSRQPVGDVFDVRMDSRNRYVSDEVFPFERKIFSAVVREMRGERLPSISMSQDISDETLIGSGTRAFEAVADEYSLDYEDVEKIYRKVSYVLGKKMK